MADLDEKDSSGSMKIVGADASGNETNYAEVTTEGELKISSFANLDYIAGNKTVTTTESLAAVGGSNLANRKILRIINRGSQDVFFGPSGITDTVGSDVITKDESVDMEVGSGIDVYILTKTGTATVTIQELS